MYSNGFDLNDFYIFSSVPVDAEVNDDVPIASFPLADETCGYTSVELLGANELAITQYDGEAEYLVNLTRDNCFELLGILKTALGIS